MKSSVGQVLFLHPLFLFYPFCQCYEYTLLVNDDNGDDDDE